MGLPRRQECIERPLERKPARDPRRDRYQLRCDACGEMFDAVRHDAVTCSARCHKQLQRDDDARANRKAERQCRAKEIIADQQRREANRPLRIYRRLKRAAAKAAAAQRREDRFEAQIEADAANERRARVRWLVRFLRFTEERDAIFRQNLLEAEADALRVWAFDVLADVEGGELADAIVVSEARDGAAGRAGDGRGVAGTDGSVGGVAGQQQRRSWFAQKRG